MIVHGFAVEGDLGFCLAPKAQHSLAPWGSAPGK
jgi:hypothetical protein